MILDYDKIPRDKTLMFPYATGKLSGALLDYMIEYSRTQQNCDIMMTLPMPRGSFRQLASSLYGRAVEMAIENDFKILSIPAEIVSSAGCENEDLQLCRNSEMIINNILAQIEYYDCNLVLPAVNLTNSPVEPIVKIIPENRFIIRPFLNATADDAQDFEEYFAGYQEQKSFDSLCPKCSFDYWNKCLGLGSICTA